MSDKLVFDLSQEVEGSPNVFVRKDWINILDNQSQNYNSNQSVIDTSQLSNSNKYMSYREAYLLMPLTLTIGGNSLTYTPSVGLPEIASGGVLGFGPFKTGTGTYSNGCDQAIGLKNWFGSMIHSMTLDYNGTTICQQSPYVNMWNSFKLMTSLSMGDVLTQGAKIGFYPDDATAFQFYPSGAGSSPSGGNPAAVTLPLISGGDFIMDGVCNNSTVLQFVESDRLQSFRSGLGNVGYKERMSYINFDGDAPVSNQIFSPSTALGGTTATYGSLMYNSAGANASEGAKQLWKSHVLTKQDGIANITNAGAGAIPTIAISKPSVFQISVSAVIYLKHLHSFFNMTPLLKGVFMKLTLNLNNTSTSLVSTVFTSEEGVTSSTKGAGLHISSVSNAVGGINPLMVSSAVSDSVSAQTGLEAEQGASVLTRFALANAPYTYAGLVTGAADAAAQWTMTYTANVSVGAKCLDSSLAQLSGVTTSGMAQSIYLYVPAYTFNPEFEQAYLSTPIKQIKYTDIYQYQISNISSNGMINSLITNGIANIKSILILPYYSPNAGDAILNVRSGVNINSNTNIAQGLPVYQSPFDPAGAGCTSPLCHLTNFNVQISGQNAIYNMQKYAFEEFNDQLYGANAVNGGLTDGLTSSLIGRQEFDMEYCYYYVNVERMLKVEEAVPKSVQIIGQNTSSKSCDYFVFIEYGVEFPVDALTGARV